MEKIIYLAFSKIERKLRVKKYMGLKVQCQFVYCQHLQHKVKMIAA